MANYLDKTGLEQLVTNIKANFTTSTQVGAAIDTKIANKANKATTLAGYGITDAKIADGVITLGTNTITPLTSHQSLADYYKKSEVDSKISAIPKFAIQVIEEALPTEGISNTTIYLKKTGDETDNLYTEYIYVNDKWETLGTQKMDLSGYLKKTETAAAAAKLSVDGGSATQPVYFKDGVPTATTYALNATVPAGAKFTDTTYTAGTGVAISNTNVISNAGVTKVVAGTSANVLAVTTNGTTANITINNVAQATNATTVNNLTVETAVPANAKFTDTVYTLPAATASALGGVMVGSNITLATGGTISLTKANVTAALGYTPVDAAGTISNEEIDALFTA